ncbi:hypothetical protein [Desulfoluna sp.]|uniref:hypothetical protein n=1 Tax=Desulfoluna sp. TaxID=2045199 RepID=UPI0026074A66|nr:hypothetical protein [Desulfoluna sp.]
MKKRRSTLMTLIAAGSFFAAGTAFAAPLNLSESTMETISGEPGLALIERGETESLELQADSNTEMNREILRRNSATDFPVESTDRVLAYDQTLQAGQASGQTAHDLMNEAIPGRLPQFFIDEAQRVVNP